MLILKDHQSAIGSSAQQSLFVLVFYVGGVCQLLTGASLVHQERNLLTGAPHPNQLPNNLTTK